MSEVAQLRRLVEEIAELTGSPPPALLSADAPILVDSALAEDGSFYLVGIIGGKEVGKSALINALVGQEITATTSFGPGTESIVAYAHEDQLQPLRSLLEAEAPGRFQIVTHSIPR